MNWYRSHNIVLWRVLGLLPMNLLLLSKSQYCLVMVLWLLPRLNLARPLCAPRLSSLFWTLGWKLTLRKRGYRSHNLFYLLANKIYLFSNYSTLFFVGCNSDISWHRMKNKHLSITILLTSDTPMYLTGFIHTSSQVIWERERRAEVKFKSGKLRSTVQRSQKRR